MKVRMIRREYSNGLVKYIVQERRWLRWNTLREYSNCGEADNYYRSLTIEPNAYKDSLMRQSRHVNVTAVEKVEFPK